jgi:hypothetical protein
MLEKAGTIIGEFQDCDGQWHFKLENEFPAKTTHINIFNIPK